MAESSAYGATILRVRAAVRPTVPDTVPAAPQPFARESSRRSTVSDPCWPPTRADVRALAATLNFAWKLFCLRSFDTCWLLFLFQSNQTFRVEVNLCWGRLLVRDRWGDLARSPREWNSPKTVGRNHCRLLRRKNRGRTRDKIRTQAKYDLQGDWYWS